MIRLGVLGHKGYPGLPEALEMLLTLAPELEIDLRFEGGLDGMLPGCTALDDMADLDALLTLGGDGTLLRGARHVASRPVPILGVNMGRLGFLTCCPAVELPNALKRLASRDYVTESRMMLVGRVSSEDHEERGEWTALNDIVVHTGGFARAVTLRVAANGDPIATYSGDGVVVSTPTGSTAYSLSAGGPVIYPTLETILVTAVSAHTLAVRPVILPATSEITVQADDGVAEFLVTVDGQVGSSFAPGETLTVRRAEAGILVIRFPGTSFFSTLRQKLGWGGLPDRDGRDE